MKRPVGPGGASTPPPRTPQAATRSSAQSEPQPTRQSKPTKPAKAAKLSRSERKAQKVSATAAARDQRRTVTAPTRPTRVEAVGSRVQGIRRPSSEPARLVAPEAPQTRNEPRRPARRLTKAQQEALEAKRKLKEAVKARKAFERDEVRRFTAHLRRRKIIWATIAGSLAAVMIFVSVGVFTPVMALQTIIVEGATRVPADQITAALQPQINKPLPLVDMGSVRKAIEAQPLVKSYSTVAVPPHTLVIKIVERGPIGYLAANGELTMVDPAGVVLERTSEKIPGIPVLTVEGGSAQSKGFAAAVEVINSLPAALAGQLEEVIANTTDDVTLVLIGGARVFWGGPENAAMKNRVLTQLLTVNPVGSVSEYDVSSPKTAVVR